MAYDKKKIYEQALKLCEEKKLFFVEDVAALLPCSLATFYVFFPAKSDELEAIKEIIGKVRVDLKVSMRAKWYQSDHPTLQIALMKLVGTDEEAHRLNGSRTELTLIPEQPLFPEDEE